MPSEYERLNDPIGAMRRLHVTHSMNHPLLLEYLTLSPYISVEFGWEVNH